MIDHRHEALDARQRVELERLRDGARMQVTGEIMQVEALRELCELYGADDPDEFGPLIERRVSSGRDGTPSVSEFLCLEVGAMLGVAPEHAVGLIWSTLDLVHRHPLLYRQVLGGAVRVWQARRITGATADLSQEAAHWVDRQVAMALGRFSFGRIMRMLPGLVAQADPALAAERADQARRAREVRVHHEAGLGTSQVFATLDHTDAIMLDAVCTVLADHLAEQGDTDTLAIRRSKALGLLATPARALATLQKVPAYGDLRIDIDAMPVTESDKLLPRSTVVVHIAAESLTDPATGVARLEDVGPVIADQLTTLLADSRVTVRPVVDLNGTPPVDSYEIPQAIRRAVARTPVDAFPYGTRRSSLCDLDHVVPYDPLGPPGQTGVDNLTPLSRRAHRAKTCGQWRYTMTPHGHHHWRSPLGYHYLTGPRGTTRHDSPLEARLQAALDAA